MPLYVWQRSITNDQGIVQPGASVEVKDAITGLLVQLYSDVDGEDALGNPFSADEDGFARFYVDIGRYRITATFGEDSRVWEDERFGTMGDEIEIRRTPAEIAAGVTPVNYAYPELNALRYGDSVNDGATDATTALRNACAVAKAKGGGTVFLPEGIYVVSTTGTPRHCVQVPSNTHLRGASAANTIITRLVENIEEESILIATEGSDTATGYDGAHDIVISDLTLRDSETAERSQTNGDLIAVGHAERVVVRDCIFGKHTQHCVDIAGSRYVKVLNCMEFNDNGSTGASANASVQIDQAVSGAFLDINGDGTPTENVLVQGNTFHSLNTNEVLHIHRGEAKNIQFIANDLKGSARNFSVVIKMDIADVSIDGLLIENNLIECTTQNNTGIAIITAGANDEHIRGVVIRGNRIKGKAFRGIYVGSHLSFDGEAMPDISDVVIEGNIVDIDCTGTGSQCVAVFARTINTVAIDDNIIRITRDTDNQQIYGILLDSSYGHANNNSITPVLTGSYVGTQFSACIGLARGASTIDEEIGFVMSAVGNTVDVSALRWGLVAVPNLTKVDRVRFSQNTFVGDLTNGDYHIYEAVIASDGSNGLMDVDFTGSGDLVLSLTTDETYSVSTGLLKGSSSNAVTSPSFFGLVYTSGASSTLATASESLLSNVADVGLQIQNYDATAGTFDIVTGTTGTQVSIVDGGADTIRTGGNIRCRFGI